MTDTTVSDALKAAMHDLSYSQSSDGWESCKNAIERAEKMEKAIEACKEYFAWAQGAEEEPSDGNEIFLRALKSLGEL